MTAPALAHRPRTLTAQIPAGGRLVASAFLIFCVVVDLWPTLVAPGDPLRTDLALAHSAPSLQHLFGTDQLGRDVFTRVVHGARLSLLIGTAATLLAVLVGIVLGLAAGLGNRVVDSVLSRVVDLMGAFPEILLALVLITLLDKGTTNLIFAIGIATAPRYARVVRAEARRVDHSEYVAQAGLLSTSRTRIVLRHILPNALGPLPLLITLGIGTSILGAAALSFIGLGPQPPSPEWGAMLSEARDDLRIAWWSVAFPGLAITATVIATTVLGRAGQHRFERRRAQ
ncbi:ABC transporter permease [Rhodococcus sp. NPDC057014]|uniref:ABC transporter permease n=1 Tax=Rhodococcus sp. NPDC057014 TaxID=3346000 RepID=UPI003630DE7B